MGCSAPRRVSPAVMVISLILLFVGVVESSFVLSIVEVRAVCTIAVVSQICLELVVTFNTQICLITFILTYGTFLKSCTELVYVWRVGTAHVKSGHIFCPLSASDKTRIEGCGSWRHPQMLGHYIVNLYCSDFLKLKFFVSLGRFSLVLVRMVCDPAGEGCTCVHRVHSCALSD